MVVTDEARSGKTVLVAEDDDMIRRLIRRALEADGFRVLSAADGSEAVREFSANLGDVGCVLLDLTMPTMGGDEALSQLMRIRNDVRVIVMSGHSEIDLAQRFAGVALAGVLRKPFDLKTLRAKVDEVMGFGASA
jgi:CheY-like chemotaxis protein